MSRRVTIPAPNTAQLGLVPLTKEGGKRADFQPSDHENLVEMRGYRLAWTRASFCPCVPLNSQTEQANPTCTICRGSGYLYFSQKAKQPASKVGALNDIQAALLAKTGAAVIRGIITGISRQQNTYSELGSYAEGQATCTVRPLNTLGRLDRLVQLDSLVVYTQKAVAPEAGKPLTLRYPVVQMNMLAVADGLTATRLVQGQHFDLVVGQVVFRAGQAPPPGAHMAAHYTTMPTWLVTDQPHSVRVQNILAKVADPLTPEGNLQYLPLQATLRLEWLVGQNEAPTLI